MRRLRAAVAAACAVAGLAGIAAAQLTRTGGTVQPSGMPGQVVGTTYNLNPAGTAIPKAAPPAGSPIGNPLVRPYNPARPYDVFKGTGLDAASVAAPVQNLPGTQNPNLLDRVYTRLAAATGFIKPSAPPRPTYTPGISRRNKDRMQARTWRKD